MSTRPGRVRVLSTHIAVDRSKVTGGLKPTKDMGTHFVFQLGTALLADSAVPGEEALWNAIGCQDLKILTKAVTDRMLRSVYSLWRRGARRETGSDRRPTDG